MNLRKAVFVFYIFILVAGGMASMFINKLGHSAMHASAPLFENKIPLLERISTLQLSVTELEVVLYEYYATTERDVFSSRYHDNMTMIQSQMDVLKNELENNNADLVEVENQIQQIISLSAALDNTLSDKPVDWDRAREILVNIRAIARNTTQLLSNIAQLIHRDLYAGGSFIANKLDVIINTVIIISIVIFSIAISVGYYVNSFMREITERRRLSMFAERNPLAIIQVSRDGLPMYSNPSSLELVDKVDGPDNDVAILLPEGLEEKITELRHSETRADYWEYNVGNLTLGCNAYYLSDLYICHLYIEDVTKKKEAERELKSSEERYRTFYDDNPSIFFTLSADGKIISVNNFGAEQLGYEKEELLGRSFNSLTPGHDREIIERALVKASVLPGETHRYNARRLCKDDRFIWVRDTVRSAVDKDGNNIMLIVSEDISKEHELSIKLSYQATHDALTGLYNRHEFENRLKILLDKAKKEKTEHNLCYVDLDQFKIINDTCGHLAGDNLLKDLGNFLNQQVPSNVTISRLGGDEFGILFENYTQAYAWRFARDLLKKIENFDFCWEGKKYSIGASIGLISFDETTDDVTSLLSLADAACYSAKDEGRNRVHVYELNDDDIERRHSEMRRVQQVKQALEDDRFSLFFQTIAPATDDHNGVSYEILVRMYDEQQKLVPPGLFLPAVERYGLSTKLDFWVIDTAFNWLSENPTALEELNHCGINLSGQTLADDSLMTFLVNKFNQGHIPPHKICFEVTETAAIANMDKAIKLISNMKERGCRFALDDFGSGLSSFAYLKNIPIDYLKIDGVFVKDIAEEPIDHAMVKSINDVGHAMGIKTIAEYVENDEIKTILRYIGVDYLQGYGIAKPIPLSEYPVPGNSDSENETLLAGNAHQ